MWVEVDNMLSECCHPCSYSLFCDSQSLVLACSYFLEYCDHPSCCARVRMQQHPSGAEYLREHKGACVCVSEFNVGVLPIRGRGDRMPALGVRQDISLAERGWQIVRFLHHIRHRKPLRNLIQWPSCYLFILDHFSSWKRHF